MPTGSPLDALLQNARHRVLRQLLANEGAFVLTLVFGGSVLLLIAGTQILDWYWLALLAAIGATVAYRRLRGRVPGLYAVAQTVDRRQELADALSTALYFHQNPEAGREAICTAQYKAAEDAASRVDLASALPFRRSRYVLPAALLGIAAAALFGLRYASQGSLDLQRPLIALASDSFFAAPNDLAQNQMKDAFKPQPMDNTGGENRKDDQEKLSNPDELPESMMEPPLGNDPQKGDSQKQIRDGKQDQNSPPGDEQKDGDSQQNKDGKSQDKEGNNAGKDGAQKDGQQGQQKNESMLDKLRDAMANMLNKLKQDQPKSAQDQQKGEKQKSDDTQQQDQQASDASSTQSGQQKQQASKQEPGDAKSGNNPDKPQSQDPSSSMGDKEGEKKIKDAQALAAMGKISELLGKRSQVIQGEMMVEVGQTKQQLKTQWSNQQSKHSDAGGEIHRDEVPLLYQQYVEQYFEEIRKAKK